MKCGIYLITCKHPRGRIYYYVGQTSNFRRRVAAHLSKLRAGKHHNRKMQFFWSKHGESAFSFSMIEECGPESLDRLEQWWLSEMVGSDYVFNYGTSPGAFMRGRKFTDEHRRKISEALTGIKRGPMSEGQRALVSARFLGKSRSEESRRKQSASQTGEKHHMWGRKGAKNPASKRVEGTCTKTGSVLHLDCLNAGAEHGFSPSKISSCCNGRIKTHLGYVWRFV